jgi:L-fuconolactonase
MTVRIDAHQHFWQLARGDYAWLTPDLQPLYRDCMPADLEPILEACGLSATVLVQAAPTDAETDFLLALVDSTPFVAAVVGWVDMESSDAPRRLAALAGHRAFVGIRPMIQDIADDGWMLRPELAPAFAALVELDLTFDALVHPRHLDNLRRLVDRYPDLRVVIDHGAKPDIAHAAFDGWAAGIAALACRSQVCCKLSGLVTEAGALATDEAVLPYADHLLATFGAERLMWGSDWPVVNLAGGYRNWWAMTRRWLGNVDPTQRDRILGGTATAFYRIRTSEHLHG